MTHEQTTSLYRVVQIIGRGGMATVYEGWDEKLERPVAIKELAAHFTEDARLMRLFFEEARKMAAVTHPNILSIYAIDESSTSPRLIMELADGGTLRDQIRRGPTQPQQARRILEQLLLGLREIHRHDGMIHRDIKPENILLVKHLYKIGDFGIAKGSGDRTAPFVTPRYTAPECLSAPELVGPASDLYSLGLVIYELVLGEERFEREVAGTLGKASPPDDGQTWFDLHLRGGDLPELRDLDENVPEGLSRIVAKMMRKDVEARYSSCDEVLAELSVGDGSATIIGGGVPTMRQPRTDKRSLLPRKWLVAGGLLLLLAVTFLLLNAERSTPIDITSEPPGAEVLAAGESLGVTPLLGLHLAEGTELLLRKEGYREAELRIGNKDSGAHANLIWQPVTISSEPEGAKVLVEGEVRGLTPFDLIGHGASTGVVLRLPGFEESILQVTPGEKRRHVVLSWQPVTVTSQPSEAQIVTAGRVLGQTPFEYIGQGGPSWLTLRKDGFEDMELELRPGQKAAHVELTARPVEPPPLAPPPHEPPPREPAALPSLEPGPPPEPVPPQSPADTLRALLDDGGDVVLELDNARALDSAGQANRLPVGTPLRFRLVSRGWSGDVLLFSLLPGGDVLRLYPNRVRRHLRIETHQDLLLPLPEDEGRGFVLETSPPLGRDQVFALVSTTPLPPVPSGESDNPWFATYSPIPTDVGPAATFLRWVAEVRRSRPTSTRLVAVDIEVVAR